MSAKYQLMLPFVVMVTLAATTSSTGQQQRQVQQRHGSGTSAILPAHVVLKADGNQPSSMNLARPGRLGSVGVGDDESRAGRRRERPGRRGPHPLLKDNDDDEQLQRQIDHSSRLLRPSPDDSLDGLPVLPLIGRYRPPSSSSPSSSGSLDPSPADLETRSLLSLLGSDFDSSFMSAARPSESILHPNGSFVPYGEELFANVGLGSTLTRLPAIRIPGRAATSSATRVIAARGREARRRLQRYLAAYSHCPLFVRWRDLGRRFWPRWIREGSCRGPSSGTASGAFGGGRVRSCSIPVGMTCRPNHSSTKTVLWWHCRTPSIVARHHQGLGRQTSGVVVGTSMPSSSSSSSSSGVNSGGGSVCGWIPIKYPVITDCKCAC